MSQKSAAFTFRYTSATFHQQLGLSVFWCGCTVADAELRPSARRCWWEQRGRACSASRERRREGERQRESGREGEREREGERSEACCRGTCSLWQSSDRTTLDYAPHSQLSISSWTCKPTVPEFANPLSLYPFSLSISLIRLPRSVHSFLTRQHRFACDGSSVQVLYAKGNYYLFFYFVRRTDK